MTNKYDNLRLNIILDRIKDKNIVGGKYCIHLFLEEIDL